MGESQGPFSPKSYWLSLPPLPIAIPVAPPPTDTQEPCGGGQGFYRAWSDTLVSFPSYSCILYFCHPPCCWNVNPQQEGRLKFRQTKKKKPRPGRSPTTERDCPCGTAGPTKQGKENDLLNCFSLNAAIGAQCTCRGSTVIYSTRALMLHLL